MILTLEEQALLKLLQAALWNIRPKAACFSDLSDKMWQNIHKLSVKQGVQALVLDGIALLPDNIQPPKNLKINWAVNVKLIEVRYEHNQQTLIQLSKLYRKENIPIMLLKGLATASCYPIPAHRESGDIDIWLFGNHSKGNKVMADIGKSIHNFDEKHSCSYFNGIPIENHIKFLNETRFHIDQQIETALNQILKEESYETMHLGKENIIIPPTTFNAMFNARHMTTHLPRELVLRHLCDWARFLYTYSGKYNTEKFIQIFEKTNMMSTIGILTQICIDYLGLPSKYIPFAIVNNTKLEERILTDVLHTKNSNPQHKCIVKRFLWKCERFFNEQWKYQLLYKENIIMRLARSVMWHYRNSRSLFI